MTRRKRIAKRTASLLLCVVLLSLNLPCFIPPADAFIPFLPLVPIVIPPIVDLIAGLEVIDIFARLGALDSMGNDYINYPGVIGLNAYQEEKSYLEYRREQIEAETGITPEDAFKVIAVLAAAGVKPEPIDWAYEYGLSFHDVSQIRDVFNRYGFAYSNPDSVAWMKTWSDNAVITSPAGDGQPSFIELYHSGLSTIWNGLAGLFGGSSGEPGLQEIPALNMFQTLAFMDCVYFGNVNGLEIYHAPPGTIYRDKYGRYVTCYAEIIDGKWSVVIKSLFAETYQNMVNGVLRDGSGIHSIVDAGVQPVLRLIMSRASGFPNNYDVYIVPVATYEGGKWLQYFPTTMPVQSSELGIPSRPITNNIGATGALLREPPPENLPEDRYRIPLPLPLTPGDVIPQDIYGGWPGLKTLDPADAIPKEGTEEDEKEGEKEEEGTEEGSGGGGAGHFHLFPFCIPFDIVDMIKGLGDTPEAPRWEIPVAISVYDERLDDVTMEIELSFLETIMPFVRFIFLFCFAVMLAKVTSSFIKW